MPPTTSQQRDAERVQALVTLYELTNADTVSVRVHLDTLARSLDMTRDQALQVYNWLKDRDLARFVTSGPTVGITAMGVDQAEKMIDDGADPAMSVMILSQEERQAVEEFLLVYRRADEANEIPLAGEERAELAAAVDTMAVQHRSPRPKRRILAIVIDEMHGLLSNAAGSGVYEALKRLAEAVF